MQRAIQSEMYLATMRVKNPLHKRIITPVQNTKLHFLFPILLQMLSVSLLHFQGAIWDGTAGGTPCESPELQGTAAFSLKDRFLGFLGFRIGKCISVTNTLPTSILCVANEQWKSSESI